MNALPSRLHRLLRAHAKASLDVAAARRVRVVAQSSSLSSSAVPSKYMPPAAANNITGRKLMKKKEYENNNNNKNKKSPHSKLLRVCSPQNANVHFAAIEADMLRLDWSTSMATLVEAWLSKYKFGNFIELEDNVRQYVIRNMVDLLYYEKDDYIINISQTATSSYNKDEEDDEEDGVASSDDGGGGGGSSGISLSDHIRYKLFPYERIIKEIVRCAIIPIGENNMTEEEEENNSSSSNSSSSSSSSYEDVLERRMMHLLTAGKLLDAMMTLDGISSSSSSSSKEQHNSNNNNNNSVRSSNNVVQRLEGASSWTVHHETCSDCLRLVVSAWSLLHRRHSSTSSKLMTTTMMTTTKLEYELLLWTERWIDLCNEKRRGIILPSTDEMLLTDIAKISLKFEKFAELDKKIHIYFLS